MVRGQDSWIDDQRIGQNINRLGRTTDSPFVDEVYGSKPKKARKYTSIKQKTKTLLLKYHVSPICAIRDISEFRDDDDLSDPRSKDYIAAAFDDFGRDLNSMSLRELHTMLTDTNADPVFMSSMHYGTLTDSVVWIDDLLRLQFHDDNELICKFLHNLVDVIDRRIPKLNSLSVYGPPSSGKNFFFDMIFAICLNYGQLGQANRNNVFAFQEAPNKRVILWNEPNYEPCLTDTIKMMLGGDPYTVRVKNNADAHVRRTPIIILTNTVVQFMVDLAFRERLVQYQWSAAPFLKDVELKPYPMAFFEILNKYNVTF